MTSKKRDLILNIGLNFLSLFILFYLIRVAADTMLPVVFGIFMMSRRFSGALANLFQLGASQTLLRHISLNSDNPASKRSLFLVGNSFYFLLLLLCIIVSIIFSESLAVLLFGSSEYQRIAIWTVIFAMVTAGQFLVLSTAMAERRIVIANIINFMTTGGWLIVAVLFVSYRSDTIDIEMVAHILAFQTLATALLCFSAFVYFMYIYSSHTDIHKTSWATTGKLYISYGIPRTAITFLDGLTLAIGPWLLRNHPVEAGYIAVALSLLRSLQGALMPIAKLTGVFVAQSIGKDDTTGAQHITRMTSGCIILISLLVAAFLPPWLNLILSLWLKDPVIINGVAAYSWMLVISIVPFMVFNGMKTTIETTWHGPRNLVSLVLSFFLFAILYTAGQGNMNFADNVSLAYNGMFWTLGVMTIIWLMPILGNIFKYYLIFDWAVAVVFIYATGWMAYDYFGNIGIIISIISVILMSGCLLLFSPSQFFQQLRRELRPKA